MSIETAVTILALILLAVGFNANHWLKLIEKDLSQIAAILRDRANPG